MSQAARFDPGAWARRLAGADCEACAAPAPADDLLWLATLPSGRVRLQDDTGFRGYCILYLHRHATELHQLTRAERGQLIEDLAGLSRAIVEVCRPAKLNTACLGNLVPHLHWHLVPRYPDDGWWGRAFSDRPAAARRPLNSQDYAALAAALRDALHAGA